MNDVRLTSLELQGFRSFRSKQTVKLPERGMVMCLGRSGHGKSNLALGISYALDYCPLPATELKAWDWDHGWGVKLGLTAGPQALTIDRGSKFNLNIDGEDITGSSASKNERISKALQLEPALLGPLTYRPQRTFGLFLSMEDDEKKEFLSKLLGLNLFENEVDKAQAKLPGLEQAVAAALAEVARLQEHVTYLDGQRQELEDEITPAKKASLGAQALAEATTAHGLAGVKVTLYKAETDKLAKDVRNTGQAFVRVMQEDFAKVKAARVPLPEVAVSAEETRLQTLRTQASEQLKSLEQLDRTQQSIYNDQRTKLQTKLYEVKGGIGSKASVKQQLVDTQHSLEHATGTSTCPTCKQEWAGEDKTEYIAELQKREAKYKAALTAIGVAELEAARLTAELQNLVFTPNPRIEQIRKALGGVDQKLAVERAAAGTNRKALEAERATEDAGWRVKIAEKNAWAERAPKQLEFDRQEGLRKLEEQMTALSAKVHEAAGVERFATAELQRIRTQNQMRREHETKRQLEIEVATEKHGIAVSNRAKAESALGTEKDFIALVGRDGYLGSIFGEVLAEIAHETNNVLVRVPNVQHMTLAFKTEAENKSGKKKARITPVMTIDGRERPFKVLSGGQTSVVELATDIAIRRVVSRRRGVHIGWMVLDEAFDGLGRAEKEECMGVLQVAAQDDLIIVVDHSTEFRDLFTQFIEVDFVEGESRIK